MRWLCILLLLTGMKSADIARPGKDYALFFAVDSYSPPLMPLKNPVANARQIAADLSARFGFQTEVVPNPNVKTIEAKIAEYADRFARNVDGKYPENGQLLIFFSGHGSEILGNGYFLPAGADPKDLLRTALPYNYLRPLINAIKCRHILVTVDACYSAYFDENFNKRPDLNFKRPGELDDGGLRLWPAARTRARGTAGGSR